MIGKALGAAAAGVVGAAALVDLGPAPARAASGNNIVAGATTTAEATTTLQYDGNPGVNVILLVNDTATGASSSAFNSALAGWAGGTSSGAGGTTTGVYGFTEAASGFGVVGTSDSGTGVMGESGLANGVLGKAAGNAAAVSGMNSGTGPGLHATSTLGRGAILTGPVAQVQLTPGSASTHPTSGHRGDLYADSTGRLWCCKTSGTHATWKQIA